MEAVHPHGELRLLRGRELALLRAPRGAHARQPGRGGPHPPLSRRPAAQQVGAGRGGRRRPRRARGLQVLRLLRPGRRRRARRGRPRPAAAAAVAGAADRRELLHLPGDLVRRRRAPRADRARAAARLRDLPHLLPPPRGGTHRPRARVPPPAGDAAQPLRRAGRRRGDAHRGRARQEGRDRRLPRAPGRRPRLRGPAGVLRAGRRARRLRVRRADLLRLLRLHGHRDRPRAAHGVRLPAELRPPVHRASACASSGAAGTSRCRATCATSSTSRSAATGRGRRGRT